MSSRAPWTPARWQTARADHPTEPMQVAGIGARRCLRRNRSDIDNLVYLVDALKFLIRANYARGMMDGVGKGRRDGIGHQRGLSRAGNARHHGERTELDLCRDVFKVVGRGTRDLERAATGLAALLGHADHALAGEVGTGHGVRACHDLLRRARANHLAAVLARAGAHIDHKVRRADGVLIMLDHDDGVTDVAQALQSLDQALVIALVQANGRLVQDIEHAHESRANLGRQADALGLAAGKRGGGAVQGKVVQANVHQKAQALQDLLDYASTDELLALAKLQRLEKLQRLAAGKAAHVINRLAAHRDGQHLRAQAGAVARGAGLLADVALQAGPGVVIGGLRIALVQDVAHARCLVSQCVSRPSCV